MAAEQGTSVSAMMRNHMMAVINSQAKGSMEETEPERRRRRLAELLEEFRLNGIGISCIENETREEMYQRGASR